VKHAALYPISSTKAMFSVDMVGVGHGNGLELMGATDTDKRWLARVMAGAAAEMGYAHTVQPADPNPASDHACFAEVGVPAVDAMSLRFEDHLYYHTPRDTLSTISIDTLRSSLELMWAALVPLAMGWEQKYLGEDLRLVPGGDPSDVKRYRRQFGPAWP
jgi:Zn-dependent M28 family amino/carboxypeptidase